jgi:hypothetical protein
LVSYDAVDGHFDVNVLGNLLEVGGGNLLFPGLLDLHLLHVGLLDDLLDPHLLLADSGDLVFSF